MAEDATTLLAEDSPTQAEQIRRVLEDAGYRVRMEFNSPDKIVEFLNSCSGRNQE